MNSDSFWQKKRVLVTGGAGFIGSHLATRLVESGAYVTVLDDLSTGKKSNLRHLDAHPLLTLSVGSITDSLTVRDACKDQHVIFHLAARPSVSRSIEAPFESHTVNVSGSMLLLEAARSSSTLEAFVSTSSSSVYGDHLKLPKVEEHIGRPLSPYALQKVTIEHYVRLYATHYGFPGVSVRPFNIFGPRQSPDSLYAAVIPKFIQLALANQDIAIFGDGLQTRDFTHVENMVDLFLRAARNAKKNAGKAFNAGAGEQHSVRQLADLILSLTQSTGKIQYLPTRPGDVRDSLADLTQSKECLGYSPLIDFKSGLKDLIDWTRGNS